MREVHACCSTVEFVGSSPGVTCDEDCVHFVQPLCPDPTWCSLRQGTLPSLKSRMSIWFSFLTLATFNANTPRVCVHHGCGHPVCPRVPEPTAAKSAAAAALAAPGADAQSFVCGIPNHVLSVS